MRKLWERLIRILLFSRFEPVESILTAVLALTSFWLIFPYWDFGTFTSATGLSISSENFIGITMLITALVHIYGMFRSSDGHPHGNVRYFSLMGMFMSYIAITALYVYVSGIDSIGWVAYAGLALLTAISYLSVSVGKKFNE